MPFIRFRNYRKSFPFKDEFKTFKVPATGKIKKLILKQIFVLKEVIITHSSIDVLSANAPTEEFYQEQSSFMNEELRNKDNFIILLTITQIFLTTIPIISVRIIVIITIIRIRITITRNTKAFLQININIIILIAELNIKLRNLQIILI